MLAVSWGPRSHCNHAARVRGTVTSALAGGQVAVGQQPALPVVQLPVHDIMQALVGLHLVLLKVRSRCVSRELMSARVRVQSLLSSVSTDLGQLERAATATSQLLCMLLC
jgi:hypothetical protein